MAKRIVLQTVTVHRDGKLHTPPIGQPFDFTAAELKDLKEVNPDAVRELTKEGQDDDNTDDTTDDEDDIDLGGDPAEDEPAPAPKPKTTAAKKPKADAAKAADDDL